MQRCLLASYGEEPSHKVMDSGPMFFSSFTNREVKHLTLYYKASIKVNMSKLVTCKKKTIAIDNLGNNTQKQQKKNTEGKKEMSIV